MFRMVVEQLKRLPMLTHCTLKYEAGTQRPQLLVVTSEFDIHLMRIDLYSHRFCNLCVGLVEKQETIVRDRERMLREAEQKLVEAKEIFPYYLPDLNNKFPASARGAL